VTDIAVLLQYYREVALLKVPQKSCS